MEEIVAFRNPTAGPVDTDKEEEGEDEPDTTVAAAIAAIDTLRRFLFAAPPSDTAQGN